MRDDWEEDFDDADADDEGSATIACPHCSEEIHEESQRCPRCGHYLSEEEEESAAKPKPWLIAVGMMLCLIVVYFWVFGRM
jgi:uncharacterized paraquat-inducible protein A